MEGRLVISLEPAYISFTEADTRRSTKRRLLFRRSCPEEIGNILRSHGVSFGQRWPIAEYIAHIPCILSEEELAQLQLASV